jgi:hypothetical protein
MIRNAWMTMKKDIQYEEHAWADENEHNSGVFFNVFGNRCPLVLIC